MRALSRTVTVIAVFLMTAAVTTWQCAPSYADSKWGTVDCSVDPQAPQCVVEVVEVQNPKGKGAGASDAAAPLKCSVGGTAVECYNALGWLGDGGCYYGKSQGNGFLPATDYYRTCIDPATGQTTASDIVTLLGQPPTLAALARQAVSRLVIPQPVIEASPAIGGPQIVQLPVWWWVPANSWRTVTATASLPGISITATATPRSITWYAGDGTQTVCTGAGTPWSQSDPPQATSPTCGHTYRSTSENQPNKKFKVRAVATWDVAWQGGGSAGTEPAQRTEETAAVEVTQLRALVRG